MLRQALLLITPNAMFTIQLHIQWIRGMASWRDGDSDGVGTGVRISLFLTGFGFAFALIQFERDLREVVELGDGATVNLDGNPAFDDAVEKSVNVRFFGKVDEGLAAFRSLHGFEVFNNLLDQREGGQKTNFEFFLVGDTVFLRRDEAATRLDTESVVIGVQELTRRVLWQVGTAPSVSRDGHRLWLWSFRLKDDSFCSHLHQTTVDHQ